MSRNLSILAVVLLLGIAALGVSYGGWSQNLTINGTVHTGTMAAEFQNLVLPSDAYASAAASAISTDKHTVTLDLTNVYPGFSGVFQVKIANTGSIPVVVSEVALVSSQSWLSATTTNCPQTQLAVGGSETCNITVTAADNTPMGGSAQLNGPLTVTQGH